MPKRKKTRKGRKTRRVRKTRKYFGGGYTPPKAAAEARKELLKSPSKSATSSKGRTPQKAVDFLNVSKQNPLDRMLKII